MTHSFREEGEGEGEELAERDRNKFSPREESRGRDLRAWEIWEREILA